MWGLYSPRFTLQGLAEAAVGPPSSGAGHRSTGNRGPAGSHVPAASAPTSTPARLPCAVAVAFTPCVSTNGRGDAVRIQAQCCHPGLKPASGTHSEEKSVSLQPGRACVPSPLPQSRTRPPPCCTPAPRQAPPVPLPKLPPRPGHTLQPSAPGIRNGHFVFARWALDSWRYHILALN